MKGSTGYNKKAAAHKAHNAHKQKLQGTVKKSASAPKASTGNKKIGGILGSYGKAMAGKSNKKAALTHAKPKPNVGKPSMGSPKMKKAVTTPKIGKPTMPKPKVGKPAMGKSKKMGKASNMGMSKKLKMGKQKKMY